MCHYNIVWYHVCQGKGVDIYIMFLKNLGYILNVLGEMACSLGGSGVLL